MFVITENIMKRPVYKNCFIVRFRLFIIDYANS